ncbi:MAG: hypothetical protein HQL49_07040 [Gammaproteobacteria bacterium]|nr:hypothetical protein [Gammaproteobacteria bacterium]
MSEVWLDVSSEEAPLPLLHAIETLSRLNGGDFLHLYHRMRPCHLYEFLKNNGFMEQTVTAVNGHCHLYIWREQDAVASAEVERTLLLDTQE